MPPGGFNSRKETASWEKERPDKEDKEDKEESGTMRPDTSKGGIIEGRGRGPKGKKGTRGRRERRAACESRDEKSSSGE